MSVAQWLSFKIDDAIKMLMDNHTGKTDVAIYLMRFKDEFIDGDKNGIVDGECREVASIGIEKGER